MRARVMSLRGSDPGGPRSRGKIFDGASGRKVWNGTAEEARESQKKDAEILCKANVGAIRAMSLKFGRHNRREVEVLAVRAAGEQFLFIEIDGWTGDAGASREDLFLLVCVARRIERHFGARANETHVTSQDVEELREFIQFRFAEAAPEGSDPRIAGGGN